MEVLSRAGALADFEKFFPLKKGNRYILLTGKASYRSSGLEQAFAGHVASLDVLHLWDFDVNPELSDIERLVDTSVAYRPDAIIAAGGGSVMDMGKLILACLAAPLEVQEIVEGKKGIRPVGIPFVAIPTTAGSGSEATHFAVAYIGEAKFSVADPSLSPSHVVLDGALTKSATRYQKACNVLDALSQAIESYWAIGSTPRSRALSLMAIELIMHNYSSYLEEDVGDDVCQLMIEASNLSGQAINMAKTTAAHAWSYAITKMHGISHGHAVWMTLPSIFAIHLDAPREKLRDPRGAEFFNENMIQLVQALGITAVDSVEKFFANLLSEMGVSAQLGIDVAVPEAERLALSKAVNSERLLNNPVEFGSTDIDRIFQLR